MGSQLLQRSCIVVTQLRICTVLCGVYTICRQTELRCIPTFHVQATSPRDVIGMQLSPGPS